MNARLRTSIAAMIAGAGLLLVACTPRRGEPPIGHGPGGGGEGGGEGEGEGEGERDVPDDDPLTWALFFHGAGAVLQRLADGSVFGFAFPSGDTSVTNERDAATDLGIDIVGSLFRMDAGGRVLWSTPLVNTARCARMHATSSAGDGVLATLACFEGGDVTLGDESVQVPAGGGTIVASFDAAGDVTALSVRPELFVVMAAFHDGGRAEIVPGADSYDIVFVDASGDETARLALPGTVPDGFNFLHEVFVVDGAEKAVAVRVTGHTEHIPFEDGHVSELVGANGEPLVSSAFGVATPAGFRWAVGTEHQSTAGVLEDQIVTAARSADGTFVVAGTLFGTPTHDLATMAPIVDAQGASTAGFMTFSADGALVSATPVATPEANALALCDATTGIACAVASGAPQDGQRLRVSDGVTTSAPVGAVLGGVIATDDGMIVAGAGLTASTEELRALLPDALAAPQEVAFIMRVTWPIASE